MLAYEYGWTDDQIEALSVDTASIYLTAVPIFQSRNKLMMLSVMDWPHQKQSYRETEHRLLYASAYPGSFDTDKPVSNDSLAKLLGG